MNISQLYNMWSKENEAYKYQEVGSGTHRFVKEMLLSVDVFKLAEGLLSTSLEKRRNEFVDEKKTKERRQVDFCIYINSEVIIPVEVEQYTHLENGIDQLVQYQIDLEKKYGILTDGYTWRFYNNNLFRSFTLDEILSGTNIFLEFWREYIKPENYYLSFFEPTGQLKLFGEELDVETNRILFFEDITTLIRILRNKLNIEGYFKGLSKNESEKKATEITYAYIIQFILYKTVVDNEFENVDKDYKDRIEAIHKDLKNKTYKATIGIIDGISHTISENIYRPFSEEQKLIRNKLMALLYEPTNKLSDIAPWLDIIVFIKKYCFKNVKNEIFGYVYENYLKELYEEEKRGQYFTDPAVVNFMLNQCGYNHKHIKDLLGEGKKSNISFIDPACGSGTFLYSATREIIGAYKDISLQTSSKEIEDIVTSNVFGLDIAEFPLYLAEMSILMRMLPLIMNEKYNNPLEKKIKVFWTKDSVVEFMGSGIETSGSDATVLGQSSFFGKLVTPTYSSYVRDENDLKEMKQSMSSCPRRRFDYVVSNPPYISYNDASKQKIPVFEMIKQQTVKLNNIYGVNLHSVPENRKKYRPNPNFYAFFLALGLALLKESGTLCYIIPQTFLVNADFDVLRYHLAKNTTIRKMIMFSGKMFLGRGLRQNKPVPTSSLILVVNRNKPEDNHVVEIISHEAADRSIQNVLQDIRQNNNVNKKKIKQRKLLGEISNWNFIKLKKEIISIYETYKENSENFSIYYEHTEAIKAFHNTFIFDGGFSIDESKFLDSPPKDKDYYERPKLDNRYWTIKNNLGYWPNERVNHYNQRFIELRQGNQGYSFLDSKYKIIWSYNATDKFHYTDKAVIWARNTMLGISSANKQEILYLFALLNSRITRFVLDYFVKIDQEDTRTILVSLQIVKKLLRVPRITKTNKIVKDKIIKIVEELIGQEAITLSNYVDFSDILMQKFEVAKVNGDKLEIINQGKAVTLNISCNSSLISKSLAEHFGIQATLDNTEKHPISELKQLPLIDAQAQKARKEYMDDLVFALYFNVEIDNKVLSDPLEVRKLCMLHAYYKLVSQRT